MTAPTLLFCTGAAKSGTSWLHRTLSDHPDCHFRAVKEVHYFDAIDFDERPQNIARVERMRDEQVAALEGGDLTVGQIARKSGHVHDMEQCLTLLRSEVEDAGAYLGYLAGGRTDERVVGDITPAYSLLSTRRLARMAGLTPDVRFIYLMRDPVARLWSHARMIAARRSKEPSEVPSRAGHILNRTIGGSESQVARRSDYATALRRMFSAVAPARRLVLFYEELFSATSIARICDFLGIGPAAPNFDKQVYAGEQLEMSDDQRRRAADWLAPQYDFVIRTLGQVPHAWRRNMAEV